jgi:hypothetical protein
MGGAYGLDFQPNHKKQETVGQVAAGKRRQPSSLNLGFLSAAATAIRFIGKITSTIVMKTIVKLLVLSALGFQVSCAVNESKNSMEIGAKLREKGSYEYNLVGKRLLRPIDEELLKRLVAQPEETGDHDSILSTWLLRIAAEGDRKYLWLLDSKELRKGGDAGREEVADILLAYDYNVNGNQKALEVLLNRLRKAMKEKQSWGVPHLYALAAVNEWDRCRQALGSQWLSADGAGGDERYGFWLTRRYFFPDNKSFPDDYQRFCRDLEQLQAKAGKDGSR